MNKAGKIAQRDKTPKKLQQLSKSQLQSKSKTVLQPNEKRKNIPELIQSQERIKLNEPLQSFIQNQEEEIQKNTLLDQQQSGQQNEFAVTVNIINDVKQENQFIQQQNQQISVESLQKQGEKGSQEQQENMDIEEKLQDQQMEIQVIVWNQAELQEAPNLKRTFFQSCNKHLDEDSNFQSKKLKVYENNSFVPGKVQSKDNQNLKPDNQPLSKQNQRNQPQRKISKARVRKKNSDTSANQQGQNGQQNWQEKLNQTLQNPDFEIKLPQVQVLKKRSNWNEVHPNPHLFLSPKVIIAPTDKIKDCSIIEEKLENEKSNQDDEFQQKQQLKSQILMLIDKIENLKHKKESESQAQDNQKSAIDLNCQLSLKQN